MKELRNGNNLMKLNLSRLKLVYDADIIKVIFFKRIYTGETNKKDIFSIFCWVF